MLSPSTLVTWIRAEYQSMPGLKLTHEQACRLWSVDDDTCDIALQSLLDEGFLHRTGTGKFVWLPRPQSKSARAHDADALPAQFRCPYCHKLNVMSADSGGLTHVSANFRCAGCRRLVSFTAMSA